MAYHSETVAATMNKINQQYFLPAIQREFVWTADQIIELFDSVMRGYPVGSFLYWISSRRTATDGMSTASSTTSSRAGATTRSRSTVGTSRVTLVLDGQQRLTAFLLGLKGSFTVKKPRMWWDNPDACLKQRLYLDLFQDPKGDPADGESGVRYGFRFMAAPKTADSGHRWLQVGKILDFDSEDRFEEFVEGEVDRLPDDSTKAQVRVVRQNLTRLFRSVWKDEVVASYTEHDQDYDRVLDIFVRANEGGTKLSKSDLLLSMVTSKWQGTNARQEIYGFVDHLNNGLLRKNNLDKDFVMKSCLVLLDLPVQYLVKNFNNPNLLLIEQRWPDIKSAIERTSPTGQLIRDRPRHARPARTRSFRSAITSSPPRADDARHIGSGRSGAGSHPHLVYRRFAASGLWWSFRHDACGVATHPSATPGRRPVPHGGAQRPHIQDARPRRVWRSGRG